MNLQRGLFHLFNLSYLLDPTYRFEAHVGEITYQYSKYAYLGGGDYGNVYKGEMINGGKTDIVAFKEAKMITVANKLLEHEKEIYQLIGDHDQIPTFHHYFPENDKRGVVIVTELLGENLEKVLKKLNRFSVVTTMKIGLRVLDVLEYLHNEKNIIHNDIHIGNMALGHKNDSRIYLFDFNWSHRFHIIDGRFELDIFYLNGHIMSSGSQQNDLIQLAEMLEELSISNQESDATGSVKTLINFKKLIEHLRTKNPPDYEIMRNLFQMELDKHKNESDFDKFDWQKH